MCFQAAAYAPDLFQAPADSGRVVSRSSSYAKSSGVRVTARPPRPVIRLLSMDSSAVLPAPRLPSTMIFEPEASRSKAIERMNTLDRMERSRSAASAPKDSVVPRSLAIPGHLGSTGRCHPVHDVEPD